MVRIVQLFTVGAISLIASVAFAQDVDTGFSDRVHSITRHQADLNDDEYQPEDTGYVRLLISSNDISRDAYCTSDNPNAFLGPVSKLLRDNLLRRNTTSGTSLRIWHGAALTSPTEANATLDINMVKVVRGHDCTTDDNQGPFRSPLVRVDSEGFSVQTRRWFTANNNTDAINRISSTLGWAVGLVDLPGDAAEEVAERSVRILDSHYARNLGSTTQRAFDPSDASGGGVQRIYIGYKGTANGEFEIDQPGARIDIRLVTVASIWEQNLPSFKTLNLKARAESGLIDATIRSSNRTLRSIITAIDMTPIFTLMANAQQHEVLNANCEALFTALTQRGGLSDVDAAVAVYSMAYTHQTLGAAPIAARRNDFLKATCLTSRSDLLKTAEITVIPEPEPVVPVTAAVANSRMSLVPAVVWMNSAQDARAPASAVFAPEVLVADLGATGLLGPGGKVDVTDLAGPLAVQFLDAGCRIVAPVLSNGQSAWPGYINRPAGSEVALLMLRRTEEAPDLAALFLFSPAPAGQTPMITHMVITPIIQPYAAQILLGHPSECGIGWRPAEIYPPLPLPPGLTPYQ